MVVKRSLCSDFFVTHVPGPPLRGIWDSQGWGPFGLVLVLWSPSVSPSRCGRHRVRHKEPSVSPVSCPSPHLPSVSVSFFLSLSPSLEDSVSPVYLFLSLWFRQSQ